MTRKADYSPRAVRQLESLYDWIAAAASPDSAARTETSIRNFCDLLAQFPEMGKARGDIMPGLRSIGFRRKATILYLTADETVEIVGIYYGGRNFIARLLNDED